MYTCPKCQRPLKNPNAWHDCVKVSIDSLFENKNQDLVIIFDKILEQIIDWEDVQVSTTSNCIVFVKSNTFLIIRPMKKELDLKFYLSEKYDEFPIYKNCAYSGKWEHHIRIDNLDDLTIDVFKFLRQSYELISQ